MQTKKKQPRTSSPDRSGDRWIHDIMSAGLTKGQEIRKDAAIDIGVKEHGGNHRNFFPHRSIPEAAAYLCWKDVVEGRKVNLPLNLQVTCGHFIVDSLPTSLKKKMQLINNISTIFR